MQRCAECRAVGLHAVCSGVQGWVSAQHVQGCVEHALACNGVHGAECTGCARLSGAYGSVQQRAMVCRACGAGWEQKGRARTRGASRGLQGAHGSVGSAGLGGSAAVCKSTQEQAGLCKSAGWGGACRVCESMHECAVPCKSAQCACSVREYAERVRARAQRWVQVCTRGGPGGPPGPPLSTERAPWGDLQRWGALGAAGRCLLREHSCCKEMAPWGRGGTSTLPLSTARSSSSHRPATPQHTSQRPPLRPHRPSGTGGGGRPWLGVSPPRPASFGGCAAVGAPHPRRVGAVPGPGAAARCGAGQKVGHVCLGGGRNSSGGFRARRRCSRPDPPRFPPGPPPPSGEPNRAADRARDAAPVGARCRPSRRWGHPGEGGSGVRVGAAVTPPRHGAGFGAAAPGRALGPSAGGTYGARPGAAANVCSIWERRADTSKYRHWPSASAARPRGHGPPPPPPLGTPPERAEPRLAGCAQRCPRPTALCLRFPSGRRAERSRQRAELGARCRPVPP